MGSKKHKKHKSERHEKYEEYSNNMDSAVQRGLKLILKVGVNATPEYNAANAASEALLTVPIEDQTCLLREKHKKSKKKKKKRDREKKRKHHKEKRHRSQHHDDDNFHHHKCEDTSKEIITKMNDEISEDERRHPKQQHLVSAADCDSTQDDFSCPEDDSQQPFQKDILFYAGITTDNSLSCHPVSKPIVAKKVDDIILDSPLSLSAVDVDSPTKPLPDMLMPSPSNSMTVTTPCGDTDTCSFTCFESKPFDGSKTPSSSSESGREPRTCVLKLKQQRSPLNKMLDHLLRSLEKRDPHQFFAWPVTDDIAPGYSKVITKPMDFSTMRQKIDDNEYSTLSEFQGDFKLMCENAIRYNHVDTVYHKAAKKMLQVGLKQLDAETLLRSLKPLSGYIRELSVKELGFEVTNRGFNYSEQQAVSEMTDEGMSLDMGDASHQNQHEDGKLTTGCDNEPKSKFEAYVDDLTPEEILKQVKNKSESASGRLRQRQSSFQMSFLRRNKEGTTTLNFLIKDGNEGPEKVVNLGDLVGKLKDGTGQLQCPQEETKRNEVKMVKPLNYGVFASFAPIFDSRFSNLSKEETRLILNTYGDSTSSEYAESILQFSKDSNYATNLTNGLLDIMTDGEHCKAMKQLQAYQEQEHEMKEVVKAFKYPNLSTGMCREEIEEEYEKYKNTRVDFNRLRSLNDLGVDVSFLDEIETEVKNYELTRRLHEHLSNNLNLIEKLRKTQYDRLSQPLPQHLANVPQPNADEICIAHQITQQLTDVVKKLPPSAVAGAHGIRKAMGISYVGVNSAVQSTQRLPVPTLLQQPVTLPIFPNASSDDANHHSNAEIPMEIDDVTNSVNSNGVDFDKELREFLDYGSNINLTTSDNIVAQLLMN